VNFGGCAEFAEWRRIHQTIACMADSFPGDRKPAFMDVFGLLFPQRAAHWAELMEVAHIFVFHARRLGLGLEDGPGPISPARNIHARGLSWIPQAMGWCMVGRAIQSRCRAGLGAHCSREHGPEMA